MPQDIPLTSTSTPAKPQGQDPPQANTAVTIPDVDIFPLKIETPKWADTIEWGKLWRIRDEKVDLYQLLMDPKTAPAKKTSYGLAIYCDQLTFSGPLDNGQLVLSSLPLPWTALKYIHIFARDFLSSVKGLQSIKLVDIDGFKFNLVCDQLPLGLTVVYQSSKPVGGSTAPAGICELSQGPNQCPTVAKGLGCPNIHAPLLGGEAGWRLNFQAPGPLKVQTLLSIPPGELADFTLEELVAYRATRIRMLPKLLQLEFITASVMIFQASPDVESIISRLRFIVSCAKDSVDQSSLAADAKTLLERVEVPFRYPGLRGTVAGLCYFVPVMNATEYMDTLNKRVADAEKLEEKCAELGDQAKAMVLSQDNMKTLIEEMAKNSRGFLDITSAEDNAVAALIDLDAKVHDMRKYVQETKVMSLKFDDGLEQYKDDERKKFVKEMWKIGAEAVIGVVAAVATLGASAPLTVANLAAATAGTIEKVDKLRNTWEAIKKLGEMIKNIWPQLNAAYNNQSSFQALGVESDARTAEKRTTATKGSLEKITQQITAQGLPSSQLASTDFLGILASWDEYDAQIEITFDNIGKALEGHVNGMMEYKLALKKQVIRGKTVLAAMRIAQDTTQLYLRQFAEKAARKQREDELSKLSKEVANKTVDEVRFRNVARLSYQRRLVKIRRGLYLRLHECALAYLYMAGASDLPDDLKNPGSTLAESVVRPDLGTSKIKSLYESLAEKVHGQTLAEVNRQEAAKIMAVNTVTHVGTVFRKNWRELAVPDGLLQFSIPWNLLEQTLSYYRLRVMTVQVDITVSDTSGGTAVSKPVAGIDYDVAIGPLMIDKNISKQPVKFYMAERSLQGETGKPISWLNEKSIFTRPPLFSEVAISIDTSVLTKTISVSKTAAISTQASASGTAAATKPLTEITDPTEMSRAMLNRDKPLADTIAKIEKIEVSFKCEGIGLAKGSGKSKS